MVIILVIVTQNLTPNIVGLMAAVTVHTTLGQSQFTNLVIGCILMIFLVAKKTSLCITRRIQGKCDI
jgi:hypothetical protein